MNRDCGLPNKEELISFPRESTYSIGNVTSPISAARFPAGRYLR